MDSTSVVGYAWRYLELRGKQNAQAKNAQTCRHTFFVEPEEDGETLLRFMKEVEPHRELIPPPQYVNNQRQLHAPKPQNLRLSINSPAIMQISRQQVRQGNAPAMTANTFSDLDAIAEMGAGAEDNESAQFSGQNTPATMHQQNTPSDSNMPPNQYGQTAQVFPEQRMGMGRIHQMHHHHHMAGMHPSQQQQMMQMSAIEQQQRFGTVYKQQQQKSQLATNTSYRLMQQSGQNTPQTGAEVFDFDDQANYGCGTITSPSYSSPPTTAGIGRRRGRGRRGGGNMGDRQLSLSSVENESTPSSPSDYNPSGRKPRGSGIRKPRKSKKQQEGLMIAGFEHQLVCQQQQQYPQQNIMQQQQMASGGGSLPNYNPALTEEEVRSRLVSEFEMYESSSSDEEMDPPPPPRNLQLVENETKMEPEGEKAASKKSNAKQKGSTSGKPPQQIKQESAVNEETKTQTQIANNAAMLSDQQPLILRDMKLGYTSSSSSSSSPTIAGNAPPQQAMEQTAAANTTESRKTSSVSTAKIESELLAKSSGLNEKKFTSTFSDLYDNEIDVIKKKTPEPSKGGGKAQSEQPPNLSTTKNTANKQTTAKELKKQQGTDEGGLNAKKQGKIVLKIKPPREGAAVHFAKAKNSSSSSPSSTSSSISASAAGQLQQQFGEQPVARLSSSGAPPSKSKQQSIQQQRQPTKRGAAFDEGGGPKQKKSRKGGEGKSSPTQRPPSSSAASKEKAKNMGKSGAKELPPTIGQHISPSPFPTLKNFKIPKVIETFEPPPAATQAVRSSLEPAQQQHSSGPIMDKETRKSSLSSTGIDSAPYSSSHSSSDYRRPGEKVSTHSKGVWEKGGGPTSSAPYSGHYNRQQQQKQDKRDRGPPDNRSKKYSSSSGHSNDRPGGRGPSKAPPPYQQQQQPRFPSPREHNNVHHPASAQNWQPFGQQQQQPFYPGYQSGGSGQRPVWQQQQPGGSHQQTPPPPQFRPPSQQQGRYDQQQQVQQQQQQPYRQLEDNNPTPSHFIDHEKPTNSKPMVEDRNDNSPSGDGLQIVDEE